MDSLRRVVCFAAIALAGCGGPPATLDTTTDASTEASLKAMTAGMSDAEKTRFEGDCDIAALPGQYETTPGPKGNGPKDKLRTLNGLTVEEIHSRATALRAKLSQ